MVRTWVSIPGMGPIKFITNYSPVETYEAAAVVKPSNKKPKQAAAKSAAAVAAPVQL